MSDRYCDECSKAWELPSLSTLLSYDEPSLAEYYDLLARFDWYYGWSDDHRVWRRGETERLRLEEIAKQSSAHQELLLAWRAHMYQGEPWGNERGPHPKRPNTGG